MTISVITPLSSAGNPFIGAAYDSLKAQAWRDFEWVVLCNKGGQATMAMRADPRVKLFREEHEGIGRLKRRACELSTGNIIVELDHDDWIWPTALERVAQAVEAGGEFLYSDFAEVLDGSFQPNTPYQIGRAHV